MTDTNSRNFSAPTSSPPHVSGTVRYLGNNKGPQTPVQQQAAKVMAPGSLCFDDDKHTTYWPPTHQ